MTKEEVQQSVLQYGKPLALNKFEWNEKTKTFSTRESNLVIDFRSVSYCSFITGSGCSFITYSNCTFRTGSGCTFKTGFGCTFITGSGCTFSTGRCCTFKTGSDCTFTTYSGCVFKTGNKCVIINRNKFEVIQPFENETIIICPFSVPGFISKLEGEDKFYLNRDKTLGEHIIADGVLSKVKSEIDYKTQAEQLQKTLDAISAAMAI